MDNKLYKLMNWPRIEGIIYSEEDNPHEVLGPRSVSGGTLFQAFFPEAESVQLILKGNKGRKMERMDEAGFLPACCPAGLRRITSMRFTLRKALRKGSRMRTAILLVWINRMWTG